MSRLTRSEIDTLIDDLTVAHPIYTPQLRALRDQSLSQEAVRDALEEAAKVADKHAKECGEKGLMPICFAHAATAIAIRALKREPNAAGRAEVESEKSDVSAKPAPAAPDVAKMEEKVWKCKVGGLAELPEGADWPMRVAVSDAFKKVTGKDAQFCFSGWGATLTEPERAVVEKRLPIHGTLPPGASDE